MSARRSRTTFDPSPPRDFPSDRAEAVVVAADLREPVELDGEAFDTGDEVPLDVAETEWDDHGGLFAVFDHRGIRVDRDPNDDRHYDLGGEAREWYDRAYRHPGVEHWDHMGFQQRRRWYAEGRR